MAATPDERQPLLPTTTESTPQTEDNEQEQLLDDVQPTPKEDDLGWRAYAFYTTIILAGTVALSLLIKGFIDSGDTNVSNEMHVRGRH